MEQEKKKRRMPQSKLGRALVSLLITAVVGAIYYYVALPPLNLQAPEFYSFFLLLCIVFVICSFIISGFRLNGGGAKAYWGFVKGQCLPVAILAAILLLVALIGALVSMPLFRAADDRDLLTVEDG